VFSDIQKSGIEAQRSSRDVQRLGNILDKVGTGGAAAFKQAAGNLGIKTEGLDDIQAAQAIINKLVPQQRPPGSGTMSDADLALYKESLPRIINQPGANQRIVESMKQINEYLIKEGEIASAVLDGEISPAEGRKRLRDLGNPVQDFFEKNPIASPGSPVAPMNSGDLNLINKYLKGNR
jgi:flagellar protein FlgJ